jgi:hypothetical protein
LVFSILLFSILVFGISGISHLDGWHGFIWHVGIRHVEGRNCNVCRKQYYLVLLKTNKNMKKADCAILLFDWQTYAQEKMQHGNAPWAE